MKNGVAGEDIFLALLMTVATQSKMARSVGTLKVGNCFSNGLEELSIAHAFV
jgi:hypothetical protein